VAIGAQRKDKKEKTLLRILEGDTVPIPNSDAAIRLLRYAPQVHNAGEGAQIVLFKPNREPRPLWVLRNFPQFGQGKEEEFIFSFEGVSSREYTGLQVTKDPGVWVVWVGCGLMVLGFVVSFFLSHQKIWVRVPKGSGEVVLAGTTNKNRVGFEKTFQRLVEEARSLGKKS
jgi:cytochrome c biogenesis protein